MNFSYNYKYIDTNIDYSNDIFYQKNNIHKNSLELLIPYDKHSIS